MTEGAGQGPADTTPQPQYSPDGQWWWTGTEWVPATAPAPVAGFGGFGAPPPRRGTNGLAIAALVLGILWMGGLGAILALIFGLVALKQIKRSGDTQSGRGLALAGTILGAVGILGAIALWVGLAVAGNSIVDRTQTAFVKVDLRQAGDAENSYYKANGRYTDTVSDLSSYGYAENPFSDVEILSATNTSYCLSGSGSNATDYWYYDNVNGLSKTPCN